LNRKAVIAIGNTLRRDDGIGVVTLDALVNCRKKCRVDYLNFGIASFDLLYRIQKYDRILLIDGINASLEPGELRIFDLSKIEYDLKDSITSSHELNLKDLFELSRRLGIKSEIFVAGIQLKDTSFGEGLSKDLENKKEEIIDGISRFISENL
jgi:hydrogenase maturation protease